MKKVSLPYGKDFLSIEVPDSADILTVPQPVPLSDPAADIQKALAGPLESGPLSALAAGKKNAALVVSDNTRPVPYKARDGILLPIFDTLKQSGIEDITIIVAAGTHRPMTQAELRNMLGEEAFGAGVAVINHNCTDKSMLRVIGGTKLTPEVTVNRLYLDAELKIITGLVEPHYMAGYSGGRKAICPGICGRNVAWSFHSAQTLNDPNVTSLKLDGNPCHEESLRIACLAGADFTVNVTINTQKRITGIFCGSLEKAHLAAVEFVGDFVTAPVEKLYDVVITQTAEAGVNHYQAVKAAFEATRALKEGGSIILAGCFTDPDPLGSDDYKDILLMLGRLGAKAFVRKLLSADWKFLNEQWEGQMWAKVFDKLGDAKRLYTCSPRLKNLSAEAIPETNVAHLIRHKPRETESAYVTRMIQDSLKKTIAQKSNASILVMPHGPYVVPVFAG